METPRYSQVEGQSLKDLIKSLQNELNKHGDIPVTFVLGHRTLQPGAVSDLIKYDEHQDVVLFGLPAARTTSRQNYSNIYHLVNNYRRTHNDREA